MQFEEKPLSARRFIRDRFSKWSLIQVELPAGKGQAQRDLIFHNGAVAVLPITEDGKTILVKQYRKAIERTSVEIPAGKLEREKMQIPKRLLFVNWKKKLATADLELLYDFILPLDFVMSGSNFMVRPT